MASPEAENSKSHESVAASAAYRVEYRNLLHEWKPDLRAFQSRVEALAQARRIREETRRNHSRRLARIMRTRIVHASLPPASNPEIRNEDRHKLIEGVLRGR